MAFESLNGRASSDQAFIRLLSAKGTGTGRSPKGRSQAKAGAPPGYARLSKLALHEHDVAKVSC